MRVCQHQLQLEAVVVKADIVNACVFFANHPDVFQSGASFFVRAFGGIKLVIITHDVTAEGINNFYQQCRGSFFDFDINIAIAVLCLTVFGNCGKSVFQSIA